MSGPKWRSRLPYICRVCWDMYSPYNKEVPCVHKECLNKEYLEDPSIGNDLQKLAKVADARLKASGIFSDGKEINYPTDRDFEAVLGPRWRCKKCKTVYYVKQPFHKLYCSECLGPLRCRRLLPANDEKPGNWSLDDDL